MSARVLVTYATRAGCTGEVAAAIGEVLGWRGFAVDVRPVKDAPSVDGYQAVVVGSAIRMGSWLPEAVKFVKRNRARLSRAPAALFTVHILNTGDDETSRQARQAYTAPVRQILPACGEVFFAGKMDYARLSFFDRLIARAVEKSTNLKEGDFRDWDKIRGWAQTILS